MANDTENSTIPSNDSVINCTNLVTKVKEPYKLYRPIASERNYSLIKHEQFNAISSTTVLFRH